MPHPLPDYQRRGRAALLGAGGLFVLAQLLGGWLLDRYGAAVRFPSAVRVLAEAPRGGCGPDVVILGSSRFQRLSAAEAQWLLRLEHPEAGPLRVHNAAVPAGDPIAEDYVLERLLRQGARPRLAVVEVSPDTVNHYNQYFAMHIHRQVTWADTPAYFMDICRSGELKKLAATRLVPLYAHRRELRRQAVLAVARLFETPPPAPEPPDPTPAVSAPVALPWAELLQVGLPPLSAEQAAAREAMARDTWKRFRDYRPGGTTAAALERLLRRCRRSGVEVVLVGAPNASYYNRNYTPEINTAYLRYINGLTQTYGCRFLDYRDAAPDQLFEDLNHLNDEGGRYFTCKLTHELLSPYWQEKRRGR
jgi:hypothetical protein